MYEELFHSYHEKKYSQEHKYPDEDEILSEVRNNDETEECSIIISGSVLVDKWNNPIVYKYHSRDFVEIMFRITSSQSDKPDFTGLKFNSGNIDYID